MKRYHVLLIALFFVVMGYVLFSDNPISNTLPNPWNWAKQSLFQEESAPNSSLPKSTGKEPEPSTNIENLTYETEPHQETFVIVYQGNVRKEPSLTSPVLTVLPVGTKVVSTDKTTINGTVWYHIDTSEGKAWISEKVVMDNESYEKEQEKNKAQNNATNSNNTTNGNTGTSPAPSTTKNKPVSIQTYTVDYVNQQLVISGSPTPYGKQKNAKGLIVDIHDVRANQKIQQRVPFQNGKVTYSYKPPYPYGELYINIDEYYDGVEDDPNLVLGNTKYQLQDGNPYLLGSYMVQTDNSTLQQLAKSITSGKSSQADKSKAIFNWVAQNIRYDTATYFSGTNKNYSAVEAYQSKLVMCTGYATLSASLHRIVGIEAKVVHGQEHAWNEVKLNGAWQTQDPTFGAGYVNKTSQAFMQRLNDAYFTKSDKSKEGELPW